MGSSRLFEDKKVKTHSAEKGVCISKQLKGRKLRQNIIFCPTKVSGRSIFSSSLLKFLKYRKHKASAILIARN